MSKLTQFIQGDDRSVTPARLNRVEERAYGRSATRMEKQAQLEQHAASLEADIGRSKVHAVASVGNEAMMAAALLAGRQRLLIETEPLAINAVSHIAARLNLALGDVVDDVVREVRS